MKYGIIDIGSNSVRLLLWSDGKTLYKTLDTTRLGEGLANTGRLSMRAMERSAEAVSKFYARAKSEGADEVYAFATAAVRSAENGGAFCEMVKKSCPLTVDVIGGEREAALGLSGALGRADGAIIDIGGGSTELTVQKGGKVVYAKSLDVGAVRLLDSCGRDRARLEELIARAVREYGEVSVDVPVYGIGGTATSVAALLLSLKAYDGEKVQDFAMGRQEIAKLCDRLFTLTPEEIERTSCLPLKRAEIIAGGALLLARLMEYLRIDCVLASEKDNLEGYLYEKLRGEHE